MSKPATKAANSEFYIARMAATSFNDRMAIRVPVGPFTENVYTFATEDAQHLVFDTQAEAEAQLVRLDTRPIE